MSKKVKNIKLEEAVLKKLHLQAIEAGFNNVQNYLEDVLIKKSENKLK